MGHPSYDVDIVRVADGEVRRYHVDEVWDEFSPKHWATGAESCDCNRYVFFAFAGGNHDYQVGGHACGHEAFRVLKAIFPDGTEQLIDGAP